MGSHGVTGDYIGAGRPSAGDQAVAEEAGLSDDALDVPDSGFGALLEPVFVSGPVADCFSDPSFCLSLFLKSVTYQPLPFRWKAGADINFFNAAL